MNKVTGIDVNLRIIDTFLPLRDVYVYTNISYTIIKTSRNSIAIIAQFSILKGTTL